MHLYSGFISLGIGGIGSTLYKTTGNMSLPVSITMSVARWVQGSKTWEGEKYVRDVIVILALLRIGLVKKNRRSIQGSVMARAKIGKMITQDLIEVLPTLMSYETLLIMYFYESLYQRIISS